MLRFIVGFILLPLALSKVYIVDNKLPEFTGKRIGTLSRPFNTIFDCIKALESPGDECQIRAGRYHESNDFNGLRATKEKPFVIRGYKDERPILDGTVVIKNLTEWKKNGEIYSAQINGPIWQLFFDTTMMTNARWPNAKWSDKSIFNGRLWPGMGPASGPGYVENLGRSLADTNINMTGAMAILNIGSFETFVAKVEGHSAGQNDFNFNDTFGDYHFDHGRSRYFLEDKLDLLDAEEEWFFDQANNTLYMIPPAGRHPNEVVLRGKVQSYALEFVDCQYIVLKNLDFFGTAVKAATPTKSSFTSDITFDSVNFKYHSYSKRMLGEIGLTAWLDISGGYKKTKPDTWGTFTFFNNTFYGSDGLALSYWGRNVTLKNNLFEYNDWSAANMVKAGGGLATIKSFSINDLFERNTLRYNGASVGIRPGQLPTVRLNDISKQCWGVIQNDGAGVQLTRKPQDQSVLEYNWVHDQPKYGLRFDGEPPKIGVHGTMKNNVVYRCNGLMAKGDYHTVTNNIAFDKKNEKDDDKQGSACMLCVLKYVRTNPVAINYHTLVTSNIADIANGGKIPKGKGAVYPIAGIVNDNAFGVNVKTELRDPDNNDFRPIPGSRSSQLNAGAYSSDVDMKQYWIPGRQLYKASSPVPVNGSVSVRTRYRDALMWLNGLQCSAHHVYFGTSTGSLQYVDSTIGLENNVVYLKERLSRGVTYKWRVDAECRGQLYHGDVWQFKTL